ncbi:hypothetical protein [Peribacillus frigoritolerans]|uniref:hypothetical protein n=1 Tax=Peribacillus frigoritolerans TaxID=450367 RepID=UPI00203F8698|nr:hypothetical protein [Peribacillus frigoritolerans]MCM3166677.1 hypothetical protein [Peribacillus frigoritolerans]
MNPENMKTPLEVLNEYNLSDFLMTSLKRNSTKDPLFKLNPLFENCSEDLPYKDIYKADSMSPPEYHKQVKQTAEREKRKFLIKGTEVR